MKKVGNSFAHHGRKKSKFLVSSIFLSQGSTKIGGMLPRVDCMVWLLFSPI
jgi:hypothetical protein